MNAILAQPSVLNNVLRSDVQRRRNTAEAYGRHESYNGGNEQIVKKLEDLLADKKESEQVMPSRTDFEKLGAGQVRQIILPVGKTLEESIDLWRAVRSDAISTPEPTTADYQLASKASVNIRQAEIQIGLHQQTQSKMNYAAVQGASEAVKVASMALPSEVDREALELQKRYKQAISSYSIQMQMKEKGFELERPRFYKAA